MPPSLQATTLGRELRAVRSAGRSRRAVSERRLVTLYRSDPAQREYVVECFRPFALSFARRMHRGHEPFEDLEQVAMFGLLKALERFDPEVGDSFTAFAAPTILGELRRHYRDTGWAVHVPRGKQEMAQAIAGARRELEAHGKASDDTALADKLGVTPDEVAAGRLAAQAQFAASFDTPVPSADGERRTIEALHGTVDPRFEKVETRSFVGSLTRDLSERDREILTMRFARGMSQAAIGAEVGVSQMQVSRILDRLMRDLRQRALSVMDAEDAAAVDPGSRAHSCA